MVDVIEPVFSIVPQEAAVVSDDERHGAVDHGLGRRLVSGVPLMAPTLQVRTSEPRSPVIAHVEPVPVDDWIDQLRPAVPGRLSVMTTPVALPSPTLRQPRVNVIGVASAHRSLRRRSW